MEVHITRARLDRPINHSEINGSQALQEAGVDVSESLLSAEGFTNLYRGYAARFKPTS